MIFAQDEPNLATAQMRMSSDEKHDDLPCFNQIGAAAFGVQDLQRNVVGLAHLLNDPHCGIKLCRGHSILTQLLRYQESSMVLEFPPEPFLLPFVLGLSKRLLEVLPVLHLVPESPIKPMIDHFTNLLATISA